MIISMSSHCYPHMSSINLVNYGSNNVRWEHVPGESHCDRHVPDDGDYDHHDLGNGDHGHHHDYHEDGGNNWG